MNKEKDYGKVTKEELASILTELGMSRLIHHGREYSDRFVQGWHEALKAVERKIEEREAQQSGAARGRKQ